MTLSQTILAVISIVARGLKPTDKIELAGELSASAYVGTRSLRPSVGDFAIGVPESVVAHALTPGSTPWRVLPVAKSSASVIVARWSTPLVYKNRAGEAKGAGSQWVLDDAKASAIQASVEASAFINAATAQYALFALDHRVPAREALALAQQLAVALRADVPTYQQWEVPLPGSLLRYPMQRFAGKGREEITRVVTSVTDRVFTVDQLTERKAS